MLPLLATVSNVESMNGLTIPVPVYTPNSVLELICSTPVFHAVTIPVVVETAVPVPAYNLFTPPPGLNWV